MMMMMMMIMIMMMMMITNKLNKKEIKVRFGFESKKSLDSNNIKNLTSDVLFNHSNLYLVEVLSGLKRHNVIS